MNNFPVEVAVVLQKILTTPIHRNGNKFYKEKIDSNFYKNYHQSEYEYVVFVRIVDVSDAKVQILDQFFCNIWKILDECIYDQKGRFIKRELFPITKKVRYEVAKRQ